MGLNFLRVSSLHQNQCWAQILRPREVGTEILQYFLPKSEIWSTILVGTELRLRLSGDVKDSQIQSCTSQATGRLMRAINEWTNKYINK